MTQKAFDLTTMGELQLRLTVPVGQRLHNVESLRVSSACSEANVAGSVSLLGLHTQLVSVTAAGPLGDRALREFRAAGVNVEHVQRPADERVALYFYEPAEAPIPAEVYFDRQDTPFRSARLADFDWSRILDSRMFFSTGITAALTGRTGDLVAGAFTEARARSVLTAFDVNFRSKLWSPADAAAFLESVAAELDVLFCSHRDAVTLFGVTGDAASTPKLLHDRFGVATVVSTAGPQGCFAYVDGKTHSGEVTPVRVLDRPGAGDAFVAGYLYGLLSGEEPTTSVNFGIAASRIALSHYGDLVPLTRADLDKGTGTDIVR